jgi:hypothetical protein
MLGPLLVGAVLGASLLGLLLSFGIGGQRTAQVCQAPMRSTESSAALPEVGTIVATIARTADQDILGVHGGTLWLIGADSVVPVDPHGGADGLGAIGRRIAIPLPGAEPPFPDEPATSGWWLSERAPSSTIAFYPETGTFGPWIDVGLRPYRVAAGDDALYVTDFEGGRVAKFDLATRAVVAELELPGAAAVAIGPDGTVLVSSREGRLVWLDPESLDILGESRIGASVMHLVADGERMVVQRNAGGALTVIDPRSVGSGEEGVGATVTSLVLTPDSAWAAEYAPPSVISPPLLRLDRGTLEPVARTVPEPGTTGESLAVVDGDLWTTGTEVQNGLPALMRIDTDPCR